MQWIKETEGGSLKIVKSEDPLLLRSLEQAIRLGQPVLIENVGEYLDPLLDPILLKEISIRGTQKIVKLGDVEVEYNESFRLYLVTSLPNPHYLPSAFIKVNLIKVIAEIPSILQNINNIKELIKILADKYFPDNQ